MTESATIETERAHVTQRAEESGGRVDAFLIYNEREDGIGAVAKLLESSGVSTHYWRRDVPVGADLTLLENERFETARTFVVALGAQGWGPNHLKQTLRAQESGKPLVPILLGDPPREAFAEADRLFERRRWLDIRQMTPEGQAALLRAITSTRPRGSQRIEEIVQVLVDGTEVQRAGIVETLRRPESVDRTALGARLRQEIAGPFSIVAERTRSQAARGPDKLPSVRSWMISVLILVDPLHPESQSVLAAHVDASIEPHDNVRFWTLAGLIQAKVPFLGSVLEKIPSSEKSDEVLTLAAAAAGTKDALERLREQLRSNRFATIVAALRAIRIVPIPALAEEVCARLFDSVEKQELAYDVLYALSLPPMAAAAVARLSASPGVAGVVELIIVTLRDSDPNAARAFASLLVVFDRAVVDALLDKARATLRDRRSADFLTDFLRQYRGASGPRDLILAGYAPETIDVDHDAFDLREDVQTLTAVMLAVDVKPPLAIGLFGDWGTGKSFFMKAMQVATRVLQASDPAGKRFCRRLVPIEFNAWHYVDTHGCPDKRSLGRNDHA